MEITASNYEIDFEEIGLDTIKITFSGCGENVFIQPKKKLKENWAIEVSNGTAIAHGDHATVITSTETEFHVGEGGGIISIKRIY